MTDKYSEALAPFKHLWKTDDEQWLAERKAQWAYISAHNFDEKESDAYKKLNGQYFIFGKKCDQHLNLLYFLTPIDSATTAKQLFDSDLFHVSEKRRLMTEYILVAMKFGDGLPWMKQNIQFFVQGVMGSQYSKLTLKSGRRLKVVSPDPSFICYVFVDAAIAVLSNKLPYHGYIECVDYAVSALAHVDEASSRQGIHIEQLLSLVDDVLLKGGAGNLDYELAQLLKEKQQEITLNWLQHA